MTILLLDFDHITYRAAASAENESLAIAIARAEDTFKRVLIETDADEYEAYLTGTNNFRYKIFPSYKANRTAPRPKHLEALREHFVVNWKAKVTDGYEADDAVAIRATECKDGFIVASLDKDLRQIPGKFYSWEIAGTTHGKQWVKPAELVYISPLEGLRTFYKSLLIGDKSDNIIGVEGIGPVKAGKFLDNMKTEQDMFDVVRMLYDDDKRMLLNGQLMWLLREEGAVWPNGLMLGLGASLSAHLEAPPEGGLPSS